MQGSVIRGTKNRREQTNGEVVVSDGYHNGGSCWSSCRPGLFREWMGEKGNPWLPTGDRILTSNIVMASAKLKVVERQLPRGLGSRLS